MPELPEVETVRRGLDQVVRRAHHRHRRGAATRGRSAATCPAPPLRRLPRRPAVGAVQRRGKYLWLAARRRGDAAGRPPRHERPAARAAGRAPAETHLRVRFRFADGGRRAALRRPAHVRRPGASSDRRRRRCPPRSRTSPATRSTRRSTTTRSWPRCAAAAPSVKRALLDQTLISGVGNIYADEALWRARLHGARPTERCPARGRRGCSPRSATCWARRSAQGGTSFDALYVNVNGESGYFDRSLDAYGREGEPCRRCGTPIRREAFMNRSSYSCPRCQPRPRSRRQRGPRVDQPCGRGRRGSGVGGLSSARPGT